MTKTENSGTMDFSKSQVQVPHEEKALQVMTPDDFIMKALESQASMDHLERLMALRERWEAKQAKAAFDEALSKFQSIVDPIVKNKDGYNKEYRYATIDRIVEAIRKPLYECGFNYRFEYRDVKKENAISVAQILEAITAHDFEKKKLSVLEKLLREIIQDKDIEVTCILTHKQGHSERTIMVGPEDHSGFKNAIQARGSSTSYLERYSLKGALGLVATETDTDGGKMKQKPLKPVDQKRFDALIEGVKAGKATAAKVIELEPTKGWRLSEEQIKALKDAEPKKATA